MNRKIHVLGGAGGIGLWFTSHVLRDALNVICYDTSLQAIRRLPKNVVGCHIDASSGLSRYAEQFQEGDWILICTPPSAIASIARDLRSSIKKNSLVVNFTSVQETAISVLKTELEALATVMGCHPLFGPTVTSPDGFAAVLVNYDEKDDTKKAFRQLLSKAGLMIAVLSAEEHDKTMAYVQALTHFCLISFAGALVDDDGGQIAARLLQVRTPNFQFVYAFAARILSQTASTIGGIQSSKAAAVVRKRFLDTATRLDSDLANAESVQQAEAVVTAFRAPMNGSDIEEGAKIAALAVRGMQDFEKVLQRYRRTGNPFILVIPRTTRFRAIRIVEVEPDAIIAEPASVANRINGVEKYAICFNENSRHNYQKHFGITLPRGGTIRIKKKNIVLMDEDDLEAFHAERVLFIEVRKTFPLPHDLRRDFFTRQLPEKIDQLIECSFVEKYKNESGRSTVSLNLTFHPRASQEALFQDVASALAAEDR